MQSKKSGKLIALSAGLLLAWLSVSCTNENKLPPKPIDEGKENEITFKYTVDPTGNADYSKVQDAIDAVRDGLEEHTYIFIKNGIYKEEIIVPKNKNYLVLVGESLDGVILTYDKAAEKINPDTGSNYGTSGSFSTKVDGLGFAAVNITFENNAGRDFGPALAIYIGADKAIFLNCRFLGRQDTFFGGRSRIYVKESYIEGTVDFILGPATAVFEDCNIHSYGGTSITAASTEYYVDYGFVFHNCKLTAEPGVRTDLGRPWRPYAAVAYLGCTMGGFIKPAGWNNWGKVENEETARFVEYQNNGEGSETDGRVSWCKILTNKGEADKFEPLEIFKKNYAEIPIEDNWNPYKVVDKINTLVSKK
ncbi:pectinesterase family protein [Belliella marina]|uniref:Pectinesterase family protein n=1 Tax=Belliella marina TaxID=1644146 RepID=A0ABW4VJ77_9BACT